MIPEILQIHHPDSIAIENYGFWNNYPRDLTADFIGVDTLGKTYQGWRVQFFRHNMISIVEEKLVVCKILGREDFQE